MESLPARVILFHKQATSARTRFLRFDHGGVCGPQALPAGAEVMDERPSGEVLAQHPGAPVQQAARELGMAPDSLAALGEFREWVEVGRESLPVFLAGFTTIDPPFDQVAAKGAAFIDLTQARGLPQAELQLLRRAYEVLLGG